LNESRLSNDAFPQFAKLPQQPAHKFIRKQQIESKRHGTFATKNQSLARIMTKK